MSLPGIDRVSTPKRDETRQRRRAKSPGRRMTDTFTRSTSGIECSPVTQQLMARRAASMSGVLPTTMTTAFTSQMSQEPLHFPVGDATSGRDFYSNTHDGVTSIGSLSFAADEENVFSENLNTCLAAPNVTQNQTEEVDSDHIPLKRRKLRHKSDVPDQENSKKPSFMGKLFSLVYKMISFILVSSVIIALLSFLVTIIIHYMVSRCKELQTNPFDLEKVQSMIFKEVVGQELAVAELMQTLEHFEAVPLSEPHIVWCVGWMGTGKSRTMDLLKRAIINQTHVQYFLPTLIPSSNEAMDEAAREAVMSMNPCLKDMVIIDGWDDSNDKTVIDFVKLLVKHVKIASLEADDVHYNQLLIVVSGVRGARAINREYLAHRILDKERNELQLDSFVSILKRTNDFDVIDPLGPLSIVPFLPLESNHVVACVKNELKYLKRLVRDKVITLGKNDALTNLSEEEIAHQVVSRHVFLPAEAPLMSSTGCKRVLSILRLILGDPESIE